MKLIIASICILALSSLGIFGVNQITAAQNETKTNATMEAKQENGTTEETPTEVDTIASDNEGNTKNQVEEKTEITENKTLVKTDSAKTEAKEVEAKEVDVKKATTKQVTANRPVVDKAPQAAKSNKAKQVTPQANKVPTTEPIKEQAAPSTVNAVQANAVNKVLDSMNNNGNINVNQGIVKQFNSIEEAKQFLQEYAATNDCDITFNGEVITGTGKNNQPAPKQPAPTQAAPKQPAPTQATPKQPAPTQPTNNSSVSNYANQVLQLVNQERAKEGLAPLTTASALTQAANKRAQETVQSFSHTRPNGSTFSTVLKEYGVTYRAAGENIAYGQRTPQEVVTGWMNSPGHRANIMNGSFGKLGVGVYQGSNGTIYWSQLFTN